MAAVYATMGQVEAKSRLIEFTLKQDFPAGLDRLWVTFSRSSYAKQKYVALGSKVVRVRRFRVTAQTIQVDLERDIPVEISRFPLWARAMTGRRQMLRHRTKWRRIDPTEVVAELDISAVGLSVGAHGLGTIVEMAPQRTRMTLKWHVESPLPVIGKRVERLFAQEMRAALADDHRFTLQYLCDLTHERWTVG